MRVSVVTTVLNEEKNVVQFLDSIVSQTKKPDEIIVVNGGSRDNTHGTLKKSQKKNRLIKIYELPNSKISEGRNFGVKNSKGEIIFTADSGTLFEKDWIKKILAGFKEADVVFGKYVSKPHNIIEKFLVSRLPNWDRVNQDKFIPSNRQCAFKKVVWEKVGGWPNHINRADDNWFHEKAHLLGFKYKFVKDATVYWMYERNLKSLLRLSFLDSKSEGFSHLFLRRKIYLAELFVLFTAILLILLGLLFNFNIILYSLIFGFFGDIIIGGLIPYKKVKDWKIFVVGIFLTPLVYFAHVFGVLTGIVQRSYKDKE